MNDALIYNEKIDLYREPMRICEMLPIGGAQEMSEWQTSFLCGLLRKFRPHKILEVGTSAGGTAAVMMNCISQIKSDCLFYSTDVSEYWYRDNNMRSGFIAEYATDIVGTEYVKHETKIGITPDIIDDIGGNIDFLLLDTIHMIPGEILDFLVCLPYLKENAIVVLHDVMHHRFSNNVYSHATQILLDSVTAIKMPVFGPDNEFDCPNISAFQINEDTRKYVFDVFSALLLTWQYRVGKEQIDAYRRKYLELDYSDTCIKVFDCCIKMYENSMKTVNRVKVDDFKLFSKYYNLLRNKEVYIYGAGEIGHLTLALLGEYFTFMGFIVSDGQYVGEGIERFTQVKGKIKDNQWIFVAVSMDKRVQIDSILKENNTKNIIHVDKDLIEYLYRV